MKDYPKLPISAILKSPSEGGSSSTTKEVGGMKKGSSGSAVKKVIALASKGKGMKGMNTYC
jgi:hypothetical protein